MLSPTWHYKEQLLSYPPRERWVREVVAYLALQGALLSYPPRERWVCDVVAYTAGDIVMRWIVRHPDPLNEGRNEEKNGNASAEEATDQGPTSHEVRMRELTLP